MRPSLLLGANQRTQIAFYESLEISVEFVVRSWHPRLIHSLGGHRAYLDYWSIFFFCQSKHGEKRESLHSKLFTPTICIVVPIEGDFSSLGYILHTSSIAAHKESLFTGKGLDCLLYRVDRNAMLAPTISTSDATLKQKTLAFEFRITMLVSVT